MNNSEIKKNLGNNSNDSLQLCAAVEFWKGLPFLNRRTWKKVSNISESSSSSTIKNTCSCYSIWQNCLFLYKYRLLFHIIWEKFHQSPAIRFIPYTNHTTCKSHMNSKPCPDGTDDNMQHSDKLSISNIFRFMFLDSQKTSWKNCSQWS